MLSFTLLVTCSASGTASADLNAIHAKPACVLLALARGNEPIHQQHV